MDADITWRLVKDGDHIPKIRQGESLLLEYTHFFLYLRDSENNCFIVLYFNKIPHNFRFKSQIFKEIEKICVARGIRNHTIYYTEKTENQINLLITLSKSGLSY